MKTKEMRRYERSWLWVKQNKQMALVFITMILQLHGCVGCVETERGGLLQLKSYFKNVLNAEERDILKSWSDDDPKSDCCLWEGIKCSDAIGGHIVNLSLNGIMPDEYFHGDKTLSFNLSLLHSFPQLTTLDFSSSGINHLFDPIHGYKSFQRLEKLSTLDFNGNNLNNSVLPFLSAVRSLKTLNLGSNELEGVFPPNELANMTELRVLNLNWNRFGSFSVQGLINLWELEVLDLSANRITDFEACEGLRTTKLKTLALSFNKFSDATRLRGLKHLVELKVLNLVSNNLNHTRSIEVLKDMPKLQELDLSGNEFTDLNSVVFPSSLQVLSLAYNQVSLTPKGYSNICALKNLRELDLRYNALKNLPYCMGNFSSLRTLVLSENQLNGNLSSFVSGLPSALEYLSLLGNNFNGSFLFNSLVNQTRLTIFKLSSKVGMVQAQAESSWVPLFQLKSLQLRNVNLGSTIPGFLVHQHDLRYVDLSYNELTGAFPTWLVQNNTRLRTLLLNSNSLTKLQLPNLVHGLQFLEITRNRIYDSVQEDIGLVFPVLSYMNLSSNHFYGTIPSSIGEMKSLQTLDVSSNGLSGQLPKTFLSSCYSLEILNLSNNHFHGEIFPEYANLTGLGWLYLGGNGFNGSLGKGLLNSNEISVFDISENSISGALPLWIGRMSSLSHLYMKGNQLNGHFPYQLQSLSRLEVMDISHNSFFGLIPSNVSFSSLLELRLQSNDFMGPVPDTLFKAEKLEVLDLGNNNFSGMVLNANGKRSRLNVLLLGNNSFQGHIPEKICQLSQVGLLDLPHNKFKGVIPSCFGNMSFGAERYETSFGPSFYHGSNPIFMHYWSYTSAFYLDDDFPTEGMKSTPPTIVDFLTKNRDEAYQGDILRYMYGLDLSSNQLSGEIPVEIGNLHSIRSLNLSNNHLTGSIQDSISKLKDLESLDLSSNKLDGNIPSQLADLDSLGYFNVSFNNLSGEIPLKGHLLTFGEMSYIGNAHLCGPPTNKSCFLTGVSESSESRQAKEEEVEGDGAIDMVWFYWTCGAVYISTSLALFVFLRIDSRWSRGWFYRVDLLVHYLQSLKDRFVSN